MPRASKAIARRKPKQRTAKPTGRPVGRPAAAPQQERRSGWRDQVAKLWSAGYRVHYLAESMDVPEIVNHAQDLMANAVSTSRYAQQQLREAGADEGFVNEYTERLMKRLRDVASIATRSSSCHSVPFSVAARSVSYLARNVPKKIWAENCASRLVVSKDTVWLMAEAMAGLGRAEFCLLQ